MSMQWKSFIVVGAAIFCFAPFQIYGRIASLNKYTPWKFTCNTIPKSGSHLIKKCLSLITNRELMGWCKDFNINCSNYIIMHSHFWPMQEYLESYEKEDIFIFCMIRDPRDYLFSFMEWRKTKAFDYFLIPKRSGLFHTYDARLGLGERYKLFIEGWAQYPYIMFIKFEDLVGAEGGGSDVVQAQVIKKIGKVLGIDLTDEEITFIQDNLYGGTVTFRKGQIGRWKKEMTLEQKELFKEYFPTDYLIELGYETDPNW